MILLRRLQIVSERLLNVRSVYINCFCLKTERGFIHELQRISNAEVKTEDRARL